MSELMPMNEPLWLLLLGLWLSLRLRRKPALFVSLPYGRGPALLTQTQLTSLQALEQAVGRGYLIFACLRLIDLVRIAPGLDLKASRQARERILNKRFDFVLCERNNREPIAVIELTEGAQRIASGNDWTAQVCAKLA